MTTDGTWYNQNPFYLPFNRWYRITLVYDPKSASGDRSGNKAYVDNRMFSLPRTDTRNHRQGTGQIVLGRAYTNVNDDYSHVFIDDLKMWNRMLTHDEIIEMGE